MGSTGSIGNSTLEVIRNDKKNFNVILLSANENYKKLVLQAKEFNAKNVLIKNKIFYQKVKEALKNTSTKVFAGNVPLNKILVLNLLNIDLKVQEEGLTNIEQIED